MRPLIIDEKVREEIARICEHADENRIDFKELQARTEIPGGFSPIGDDPNFCCHIDLGFRCVFSIEEQPSGWCKHLSVSVDDVNKVPAIEAVKVLMEEFGINKSLEECYVYMEETTPRAVNIISPI
jgi:hypothetical protein